MLAHSVTGRGKTSSYLLPILQKYLRHRMDTRPQVFLRSVGLTVQKSQLSICRFRHIDVVVVIDVVDAIDAIDVVDAIDAIDAGMNPK